MLKVAAKFMLALAAVSIVFPKAVFPVQAAGATLFFSPSSGAYAVKQSFNVRVMVNSGGGVGINAAEGNISFDPAMLLVSKVSNANSIFELWTTKPTYSNNNGSVSFGGGSPGPFTGTAGGVMTITFVARKAGIATVTFTSGSILAADGKGSNVYTGSGAASFEIKEEAAEAPKEETKPEEKKEEPKKLEAPKKEEPKGNTPVAPEINSASHPEENKWYADNNPVFSWKLYADINGVSVILTRSDSSNPGTVSDGMIEEKKYENAEEGASFVHLKFKNQNGWGATAHRKIMIDTKAPEISELVVNNLNDPTNPSPLIEFRADDRTSGLAGLKAVVDGNESILDINKHKSNPFKTNVLKPGEHTILIVATDLAGNSASSSERFTVEPLKAPVITKLPEAAYQNERFSIIGTSFYADSGIVIAVMKDGKEFDTLKAETDNAGNWSYYYDRDLEKGAYEFSARIADQRGAESYPSEKKRLAVMSPSIIQSYGWLIIAMLILLIVILAGLLVYQHYYYKNKLARIQRENNEVADKLGEVFTALREEADELMEYADKKAGLSEAEKRVKDKLKEAINISEEFINKEVLDVDKEIK